MLSHDDIQFHSERARAELELAGSAVSASAAKAHRGLSALHLDRLKNLGEAAPQLIAKFI